MVRVSLQKCDTYDGDLSKGLIEKGIEVDFACQDITTAQGTSVFDHCIPTFLLCEGVMHYLSAEAVNKTVRCIAALSAKRSRLVFTFIRRGLLDRSVSFGDIGSMPVTLEESGETWTFGFRPEELQIYLAERGFILGPTSVRNRIAPSTWELRVAI